MKKILCPCDFSVSAIHGIEFASEVCKRVNASMTLCHIQPSVWPEAIFLEPIVEESMESTEEKMYVIANNIKEQFNVNTKILNPRSTDTVEKAIGNLSEEYDAIILGTNGVDDAFQFLFGSTAFNIAKTSSCPVLLVPEISQSQIPEGMIYLHQEKVNPGLDILIPVWWSQLLNIPFGIWVLPSEDEMSDRQLVRTISEELRVGGPENLIAFVEIYPGTNRYNPRNQWIHAMAIHHQRVSGKNSGRKLVRKNMTTSDNPLLIFGVGH